MSISPTNQNFNLNTPVEIPGPHKKVRFKRLPQVITFRHIQDKILLTMTPVKPDLAPDSPLYQATLLNSPKK